MYLEVNNLKKSFGGVVALDDVSLEFPAGQVTAVIGPNGAGKTTLFNVIAGFVAVESGTVRIVEKEESPSEFIELTNLGPQKIAQRGVGVLFQDIRVFGQLTALENVLVGFSHQLGENPFMAFLKPDAVAQQERDNIAAALEHLEFVGLRDKAQLWASALSFGQQKLIALARLLAADARIIMLDEPTSGIHPVMIDSLMGLVESLAHDCGKVVIIVEHALQVVQRADWIHLMAGGRAEIFGKPSEVLRDKSLGHIYPTL